MNTRSVLCFIYVTPFQDDKIAVIIFLFQAVTGSIKTFIEKNVFLFCFSISVVLSLVLFFLLQVVFREENTYKSLLQLVMLFCEDYLSSLLGSA